MQGLPDSSEVHFARAFLLVGLQRYPEAQKEVERVNEGPERDMLVQLQVLYAMMEMRSKQLDSELEALESAPESRETLLKKIRLLREKTGLLDNGPERDALLKELDELGKRAETKPGPPKG